MDTTRKFGLIGKNISYSFSKKYFTDKFQKLLLQKHQHELLDFQSIDEVEQFLSKTDYIGLNVTIPYKTEIIPFLDNLSEEAKEIGAINTIKIKEGKKTGYNTDAFGFEKTLLLHKKSHHTKALILGDGGAAKAVKYILKKHNIPFLTIARSAEVTFETITPEIVEEHLLIIQTTPVGTFPNTEDSVPFPFQAISERHLVIDLIYNPTYTKFMRLAAEHNAKTVNGYFMLEQQAEKAWEIWNS